MLFAVFIALLLIGAIAAAVIFGRRRPRAEALLVSFPVVLVAYSAVVFILNQFAGVRIGLPAVLTTSAGIAAVLVVAALIVTGGPAKWWSIIRSSLYDFRIDLGSPQARFVGGLLAAGAVMLVITAFLGAPQEDDNYIYHLSFIQHIWQTGQLPAQVSLSYHEMTNAYPPAVFIFYASTWITLDHQSFLVMEITSLLFALGIAFFTYRICRTFVAEGEIAALLAALLLTSYPAIAYVLISTNTDTIQHFFCLAGLFFLIEYLREGHKSSLLLSIVLEACGCWVKLQAGAFIAAVGVAWVAFWLVSAAFPSRSRGDLKFPIGGAFLWGAGILALIAPYMLRNFLRLGNPLYPAFPELFGGVDVNDWTLSWLFTRIQLLLHQPESSGVFNLLLFAGVFLLPAAVGYCRPRVRSVFSFLLVSVAVYGFLWFRFLIPPYSGIVPRFFIAGMAVIVCLTSPVLATILLDERPPRSSSNILVLATLVLTVALSLALGRFEFTGSDYIFPTSKTYGAFGTVINYLLRYNKYHHFVLYAMGIVLLTCLSYLGHRPGYQSSCRLYRRFIAAVLAASLLLYPAERAVGTVYAALRSETSIEAVRSHALGQSVAIYTRDRLPANAKILTFFSLKYLIPRSVVPADAVVMREPVEDGVHGIFDTSSPTRKFYMSEPRDQFTDSGIRRALRVLKREGITHVLIGDWIDDQDLFDKSPIFSNVGHNPRYFKIVAWGPNSQHMFISLFEVLYPPDL